MKIELLDAVNYYVNMFFVVLAIAGLLLFGVLFYILKVRKVTAKTERINYDNFVRRDSLEYVKFEDIISEDPDDPKSCGMIALGNNVFVGGINVIGYNYISASAVERERTMVNAIGFFNRVEEPIQMRQTVKAVDLGHNITVHNEILERLGYELMELTDEYNDTVRAADDYIDVPEEYAVYEKQILRLQRTIQSKMHQVDEAKVLIEYMTKMANGEATEAQKINQIMFTYYYDPSEYTEELSKENIYIRAFDALKAKASSYGEGLLNCGCTFKMLSASDLIELMRKHTQPLTSEELKIEDIFNSSYNALFVTSDSLIDLERERLGDEAFERQMEQIRIQQEEDLRRVRLESERAKNKALEDAHEKAVYLEGAY